MATVPKIMALDHASQKAAGKSFDHVARARVFLTNMSDYVAMNGPRKTSSRRSIRM